jgi:hypothetical protein
MSYSKEFDTPEYQDKRSRLQRDTASSSLKPLSFEVFAKTPNEKMIAHHTKRAWKDAMRAQHGRNWRKHNNPVV